jgi:hypothetical protein
MGFVTGEFYYKEQRRCKNKVALHVVDYKNEKRGNAGKNNEKRELE